MDKVSFKLLKKFRGSGLLTEFQINEFTNFHEEYTNPYLQNLRSEYKYLDDSHADQTPNEYGNMPRSNGYKINIRGRAYIEEHRSTIIHKWILSIAGFITAFSTFGALIYSLIINSK